MSLADNVIRLMRAELAELEELEDIERVTGGRPGDKRKMELPWQSLLAGKCT